MTFVAAVAAGSQAVESVQSFAADGDVTLVRHRDLTVAWARSCRWISTADDGDVLVVLDGRLHNVSSPADGQAELLLERYRDQGAEVARGLLGDFVVIVLDRRTNTLLVARDPIGVRPWYQAATGSRHAGASDVATLTAIPWVDTAINERIAIEYLASVEESRGETLYRGIGTLRPGQTWLVRGGRSSTIVHHHWNVRPELDLSWEDAAERCRAVLDEAVRCRVATGPPTSELSGGLDSSTVVGTLVNLGFEDLVVGRMIFDGPRADERAYSEAVIRHWRLPEIAASPWVATDEERTELGRHLRRPCPDANFTMFTNLYRALGRAGRYEGVTGAGGDDAFVAMGVGPRVVSAVKLVQLPVLRELVLGACRGPIRSWHEVVKPTLGYLAGPWRNTRRKKWLPIWVSDTAVQRGELRRRLGQRPARVTGIDAIDDRFGIVTSGYLASVLETRALIADWLGRRDSHPFFDPRFMEATYGFDPWWPTTGGHYRALQVEAFRDRLPPAVARRRSKADFSEIFWPQILDDATLRRVRTGALRDRGWLDLDGFETLVANAKRGMANAAIPLFRCVSLDHWARTQ